MVDDQVNSIVNLENAKLFINDLQNQEELKDYIFKMEPELESAAVAVESLLSEKLHLEKLQTSIYCPKI